MKAAASRRTPYWAIALALMLATATHAQEAFDAEKTKALFAGTEWNYRNWDDWWLNVSFLPNGTLIIKDGLKDKGQEKASKWIPSGANSVKCDDKEWTLSPNKKELYMSGKWFHVFHRGTKYPPEYPFLRPTVASQGIVWVEQGTSKRKTVAFNAELDAVWGEDGVQRGPLRSGSTRMWGGGQFYYQMDEKSGLMFYLIQGENGGQILRDWERRIYKPEPAQPGDPLPPQQISRARSPFGGTSWCRLDGKGKLHIITFAASGTVSDTSAPNEKPEWNPYDDNTIRYKVKDETRRLALSADKKTLTREDSKRREIWFSGRQPPRVGMMETKQIKELLSDKDKAWVHWDEGKKTVYTFDDKSANVSITVDDGKPTVVRWEMLCAGCIRIGDEAFMIEGETLERVEPRLTLKRVPKDSVR